MKLLVFGKTGQVAHELAARAGPDLAITCLPREEADLADPAAVKAAIADTDADAIINAAAYTAVDKAEEEEALALRINGNAPGIMARAAAARGLPLVHISTDYVFDGSGEKAWVEDDPTGPMGAYGRTKLAGETAVAAAGGAHVILRTAWVFSVHGNNFVKTMLRVGKDRGKLTVVGDQRGGPTWAGDIAIASIAAARQLADGAPSGIYHFSGQPAVSWADFARAIFAATGWSDVPEIEDIPTSAWPTPAARPANSVLNCEKFASVFDVPQPDWRDGLRTVLKELS